MKKILFYCFIVLSISSCKAQSTPIDLDTKDLIVFKFKKDSINIVNNKYVTEIYNKQDKLVLTQEWVGYGYRYFEKSYIFIKNKDTMNLKCISGQGSNFYFKDILFQKGDYELRFEMPKLIIKGSELVDKELNKLTFKNAYIREENSKVIKQVPFKELDFYKISLKDKGVIWKKLDEKK